MVRMQDITWLKSCRVTSSAVYWVTQHQDLVARKWGWNLVFESLGHFFEVWSLSSPHWQMRGSRCISEIAGTPLN